MRVIFMGTPAFAVPSLGALIANGHEVVAVYTQPPRPSGRGHKTTPSPVHQFADDHGIEVRTPPSFKDPEAKAAFADLDADVGIVVAYGLILPQAILDAPKFGCLNVHGSLLPRWRGAAPIQRAIMASDPVTGVQVMQMERGLDTGPILLSETVPIAPNDTAASLADRLSHIGAELLPRALAAVSRGGIVPQTQAADGITYAHKISADDARIDWSQPAAAIDAHIRGLTPVPGAWTQADRDGAPVRLKIHRAHPLLDRPADDAVPGTILAATGEGVDVAAGNNTVLRIDRLQRPSKAAQDADSFLRGWPLSPGARLT